MHKRSRLQRTMFQSRLKLHGKTVPRPLSLEKIQHRHRMFHHFQVIRHFILFFCHSSRGSGLYFRGCWASIHLKNLKLKQNYLHSQGNWQSQSGANCDSEWQAVPSTQWVCFDGVHSQQGFITIPSFTRYQIFDSKKLRNFSLIW